MPYPVTLIDLIAILFAAECVRTALPDLSARPRRLWRIGHSPLFALMASLIVLAGAVVTPQHDIAWLGTSLCGTLIGLLRGRRIAVDTDQIWGTVRVEVQYDAIAASVCVFAITLADGLSGLLPDQLPRHAHMAAASGLFAGYLAGRAWSLARRAVDAPHTELSVP